LVSVESNCKISIWVQGIIAVCKSKKAVSGSDIRKKRSLPKPEAKINEGLITGWCIMPDKLHIVTRNIDTSAKCHKQEWIIFAIFSFREKAAG
jgi:hypothetical protein